MSSSSKARASDAEAAFHQYQAHHPIAPLSARQQQQRQERNQQEQQHRQEQLEEQQQQQQQIQLQQHAQLQLQQELQQQQRLQLQQQQLQQQLARRQQQRLQQQEQASLLPNVLEQQQDPPASIYDRALVSVRQQYQAQQQAAAASQAAAAAAAAWGHHPAWDAYGSTGAYAAARHQQQPNRVLYSHAQAGAPGTRLVHPNLVRMHPANNRMPSQAEIAQAFANNVHGPSLYYRLMNNVPQGTDLAAMQKSSAPMMEGYGRRPKRSRSRAPASAEAPSRTSSDGAGPPALAPAPSSANKNKDVDDDNDDVKNNDKNNNNKNNENNKTNQEAVEAGGARLLVTEIDGHAGVEPAGGLKSVVWDAAQDQADLEESMSRYSPTKTTRAALDDDTVASTGSIRDLVITKIDGHEGVEPKKDKPLALAPSPEREEPPRSPSRSLHLFEQIQVCPFFPLSDFFLAGALQKQPRDLRDLRPPLFHGPRQTRRARRTRTPGHPPRPLQRTRHPLQGPGRRPHRRSH